MSEEGEVRLHYNEEEEEQRIEAEQIEEAARETDYLRKRYWEELDERRWKWTNIAQVFNAPVKVEFT